MSFNRTKYDTTAYELQMNRSTSPGDYRLYAPFGENCDQCYSYSGPIGSKSDVSLVKKPNDLNFKDMADTESQLSWRNNKLSKSNNSISLLESIHVKFMYPDGSLVNFRNMNHSFTLLIKNEIKNI